MCNTGLHKLIMLLPASSTSQLTVFKRLPLSDALRQLSTAQEQPVVSQEHRALPLIRLVSAIVQHTIKFDLLAAFALWIALVMVVVNLPLGLSQVALLGFGSVGILASLCAKALYRRRLADQLEQHIEASTRNE